MSQKNQIIIGVDFDGTIVTHDFPRIGKLVPYAKKVLTKLSTIPEVQLMLWTMRSTLQIRPDKDSEPVDTLQEAFDFLKMHDLKFNLDWLNFNPDQSWSHSNKQFAHIYIDDAALGCPLVRFSNSQRYTVDWFAVELLLQNPSINPLLSALYLKTKAKTSQLGCLLQYGNSYAIGVTNEQESATAFYIPHFEYGVVPMQNLYSDINRDFPFSSFYLNHPELRGSVVILYNNRPVASIHEDLGLLLLQNETSEEAFQFLHSLQWTVYELPTRSKQILNSL
jgi:hypothetical protein